MQQSDHLYPRNSSLLKRFLMYGHHVFRLFLDDNKLNAEVRKHLGLQENGDKPDSSNMNVTLLPYTDVVKQLKQIVEHTDKKVWVRKPTPFYSGNQKSNPRVLFR